MAKGKDHRPTVKLMMAILPASSSLVPFHTYSQPPVQAIRYYSFFRKKAYHTFFQAKIVFKPFPHPHLKSKFFLGMCYVKQIKVGSPSLEARMVAPKAPTDSLIRFDLPLGTTTPHTHSPFHQPYPRHSEEFQKAKAVNHSLKSQ